MGLLRSHYVFVHLISPLFLGRWVRFGKDLELLDSPGIIPMRISDQSAAIKLAICDDIGERSYDVTNIAAVLVQMLSKHPAVGVFSPSLFSNCSLCSLLNSIFSFASMPKNFICSLQVQKLCTTVTRLRWIVNVVKRKL